MLEEIVASTRRELIRRKQDLPLEALVEAAVGRSGPSLSRAIREKNRAGDVAIVAEIKKASPSRGVLRADFDPVALARRCAECGAAGVSVLTETSYFQGSLEHLRAVRRAVDLPLLRKDFVVDLYQVYEAAAAGADAFLLIAAVLDEPELRDLVALGAELGMEAVVEVFSEEELGRSLAAAPPLLGINNRNLRTFLTDLRITESLLPRVPADLLVISESGVHERAHIDRLRAAGAHAFLVGEALMQAPDPGRKLLELLGRAADLAAPRGQVGRG